MSRSPALRRYFHLGSALLLALALPVGVLAQGASVQDLVPATAEATLPEIMPVAIELPEPTTTTVPPVAIELTAVPPRLGDDYSLTVKPGETIQASVEIRNPQDTAITVESFVKDFYIGADGLTPIPVETDQANPRWQLSPWITLTPNANEIAPRGSATVVVTISVPADALPGGRYAMVLHRPVLGNLDLSNSGAQVTAQTGTLLYVLVDGPLSEEASVTNFSFGGVQEKGPVPFSVTIRNDSSFHLRPEVSVTITNMFGRQVGEVKLDTTNIFPETERTLESTWDTTWGFGLYRAQLSGTYGAAFTTPKTLSSETSFWFLPYKIIAVVVGVIVLGAILITLSRRRYRRLLEEEEAKVRQLDEKLQAARQHHGEKSEPGESEKSDSADDSQT